MSTLNVNHQGAAAAAELNKDVISDYIQQLREIADVTPAELLPIATRLPDALQSAEVLPDDNQKKEVFGLVQQAIKQLIDYQTAEGQAMIKDLNAQIESIKKGLEHVNDKKDLRIQQVRSKLQDNLKNLAVEVDQNRFEQELIFYLEKFDINEEIVRLRQHLLYFCEVMNNERETKGKKLGFIAQEIGREINTIGSKANDASSTKRNRSNERCSRTHQGTTAQHSLNGKREMYCAFSALGKWKNNLGKTITTKQIPSARVFDFSNLS